MTKICSHCKLEKAQVEFYKDRTRHDGLFPQCKVCNKTSVLEYQATERGKVARRRYQITDIGRAIDRRTQEKRKVAKNLQHAEYCKTPNGRLVCQQKTRRRRELKQNLDIQFTHNDVKLVHERFENKCFNCASIKHLAIDHHRPLSRGYGLMINNAVLLCRSCNSSKLNKMPEDFYTVEQLEKLHAIGVI